jgi:hypothetical protein
MHKNILVKVKNIPRAWWIFAAILIVGIFLRIYHHHDWLRFNADQGRDAAIVSGVVDGNSQWPLVGPKAGGTEFQLGPAFYYFEIVSAKIFGNAPDKMTYPDLVTGILCVPLLFFFLRKYFDKYTALSMSAIFAVSAYAIRYARFGWNPNSTPFWTLLFLYAIHEVISEKNNRKFVWAIIAGIAMGVDVQLHTILLILIPITAIVVFLYYSFKNIKLWKFFLAILAVALLVNAPQFSRGYQKNYKNLKYLLRGATIKEKTESSILNNTIQSSSCWIQGNLDIITGYEISDNCSFVPSKKAGDSLAFLLGSIFVVVGTILWLKRFFRESDHDRKSFSGIVLLFTGISYLLYLKIAFELSVRFYLPLIFLPFMMLGFWIQFIAKKFKMRDLYILLIATVVFAGSNLFFLQKYFIALANYGNVGGSSVDVVILKEAEVFSSFIVNNSNSVKDVYIDGDAAFMFRAYKPIRYLVGRSNIKLLSANKNTKLPNQYFYATSLVNKDKMIKEHALNVLRAESYGSYAMLLVQNQ